MQQYQPCSPKVLGLMHKSLIGKSKLLPGVNVCECVCLVMDW